MKKQNKSWKSDFFLDEKKMIGRAGPVLVGTFVKGLKICENPLKSIKIQVENEIRVSM